MYCSNQSSMATLLQQKSFMKNLTNGGNNVVVVTNNDNGQTSSLQSASSVVNNSTTRVLLPHEMESSAQNLLVSKSALDRQKGCWSNNIVDNLDMIPHATLIHSQQQLHQQQNIATTTLSSYPSSHINSFNHQFINHLQSNSQLQTTQLFNPHVHIQQPFNEYNHVYRPAMTTANHIFVNGQTDDTHNQTHQEQQQDEHTKEAAPNEENTDVTNENTNAIPESFLDEMENEPEIDIVINNVVCSFSVRCHLNLREIALNGFNVEFRRENGMVTMKLRQPYTTASIWSSGKITCTGATSEDQAKVAARRYSRCLQKLGFNVKFRNFRIVNVLGTCSMPWGINIIEFSKKYKDHGASYEPELHPGVTYKLKQNPKATLKIFSTGSITVTAASVAFVQAAIEHIFPLVYEFKKAKPVKPPTSEAVVKPPVIEVDDLDPLGNNEHAEDDNEDEDDDEDEYNPYPSSKANKNTKLQNRQAINKKSRFGKTKFFNKKKQTKRPAGKADNDPKEDIMNISDSEIFSDDSC